MSYQEDWKRIHILQDQFYPNWLEKCPHTLYASGLAGELGEVCSTVTHLEGGGTNLKAYNRGQVLHQCADTYVQMVLLLIHYGFTFKDFQRELKWILDQELPIRLSERNRGKETKMMKPEQSEIKLPCIFGKEITDNCNVRQEITKANMTIQKWVRPKPSGLPKEADDFLNRFDESINNDFQVLSAFCEYCIILHIYATNKLRENAKLQDKRDEEEIEK